MDYRRKTYPKRFMQYFLLKLTVVPQNIGTKYMTRMEALEHNTIFTRCFYGDNVTLILDEIYI